MEVELIDCGNDDAERLAMRGEATIRFVLTKVSAMGDYTETPLFYLRTIPWRVRIYKKWQEMQLAISCELKCQSQWSCIAKFEFRLLKVDTTKEPFVKMVPPQKFEPKMFTWAVECLSWESIVHADNGYIKNDSVTIELYIQSEVPVGVEWSSDDLNLLENQILSLHSNNTTYKRRLQTYTFQLEQEKQKVEQLERKLATSEQIKQQLRMAAKEWIDGTSHCVRLLDGTLLNQLRSELQLPTNASISLHIADDSRAVIQIPIAGTSQNSDENIAQNVIGGEQCTDEECQLTRQHRPVDDLLSGSESSCYDEAQEHNTPHLALPAPPPTEEKRPSSSGEYSPIPTCSKLDPETMRESVQSTFDYIENKFESFQSLSGVHEDSTFFDQKMFKLRKKLAVMREERLRNEIAFNAASLRLAQEAQDNDTVSIQIDSDSFIRELKKPDHDADDDDTESKSEMLHLIQATESRGVMPPPTPEVPTTTTTTTTPSHKKNVAAVSAHLRSASNNFTCENKELKSQIMQLQHEVVLQKHAINKLKDDMKISMVETEREVKRRALLEMQKMIAQFTDMFTNWTNQLMGSQK